MPDEEKPIHSIGRHEMTWTDPEDGVTHAWAHVATGIGEVVTKCDLFLKSQNPYYTSNNAPTMVTCLECIANPHGFTSVLRCSVRLRDEP